MGHAAAIFILNFRRRQENYTGGMNVFVTGGDGDLACGQIVRFRSLIQRHFLGIVWLPLKCR